MAKIQLNGRKISIKQKISMFEILQKYKIDSSKVAIELNGLILSKKLFKRKILKNNDKIEIVHFIGGG
tara:strand:+ start:1107 stop:1310 length:204 start_codon:yes stop_codon:yes gene_type:complete